jgi:hypothetical protein
MGGGLCDSLPPPLAARAPAPRWLARVSHCLPCGALVACGNLSWRYFVSTTRVSLASFRRDSGQYSFRPLLNSRARWFLLSQGVPSATLMPLSEVLVVLLSLSCLILHGSEGSARARTLGVHLCSTYGCSVGLWLVG